ncbi:MAG: E3 binding domain-containing protein, partial [Elusimicrobia bacterium]|nr:E3 binding domain-containing protein [Elusimicrobiota bacterium]
MSEVTVSMPRLGESVTEGTLVKWHVQPGAKVAALDVIAEVDTDKVSAEIPAPVSGKVLTLLVDEGATIPVGGEIAVIETEAAVASPPAPTLLEEAPAVVAQTITAPAPEVHAHSPAVRALAEANRIDLGSMPGTGANGRITRNDVLREIARVQRDPEVPRSLQSAAAESDTVV